MATTTISIKNRSSIQFVLSQAQLTQGSWSGNPPQNGTLLLETDQLDLRSDAVGGTEGRVVLTTTNMPGNVKPLEFRWTAGSRDYFLAQVPPGIDAFYEGGETDPVTLNVVIENTALLQTNFTPAANGWKFSNTSWTSLPNRTIQIPNPIPPFIPLQIGIGNASDGMCGGMVYSAIDYFLAGRPIPARTDTPSNAADPDFDYISRRLWDSFHLDELFTNSALATYLAYMTYDNANRAKVTIASLAKIRADIAAGRPSALGLIGAQAPNIIQGVGVLGKNHQVAAYTYIRDGHEVGLGIYDPNAPYRPASPGDSMRFIKINAEDRTVPRVEMNLGSVPQLYAFFHTGYTQVAPP